MLLTEYVAEPKCKRFYDRTNVSNTDIKYPKNQVLKIKGEILYINSAFNKSDTWY